MHSPVECPVCCGSSRPLFMKHGFGILQCSRCGHQMAELKDIERHIERTYGDDYFTGGGPGYSDYVSEGTLLRASGRRYARLLSSYTRPGRILDIGAAAGFHLKGFEDCGWRGTGVEPNAAMARYAKQVLGVEAIAQPFELAELDCEFDAISLIQVIAHFLDPAKVIQKTEKLAKNGGVIIIETWNRRSITARLFGRYWHEYSPPSVLHWFSIKGLGDLCANCGLEMVRSGRPLKMIQAGHAKSLIEHKFGKSKLVSLLPSNLNIIYPFDDVFWLLLRKP